MKKSYEQVVWQAFVFERDVITTSDGQQVIGADNVIDWWKMEGSENENE